MLRARGRGRGRVSSRDRKLRRHAAGLDMQDVWRCAAGVLLLFASRASEL